MSKISFRQLSFIEYQSRCAWTILKRMADHTADYFLRSAAPQDAGLIAAQRAAMFRDMGHVSPEQSERLREASEPWVAGLLAQGHYFGWLVEYGTAVVAGGGIILRDWMPAPGCYRVGRWGHIVNVYTHPDHRRRGLAS